MDILSAIIQEANSYKGLQDLEKLLDTQGDFSCVPVQPLYLILKSSANDQVALALAKLGKESRKVMLDLDLWQKDELNPESFEFWLEAYAHCPEDAIRLEFAKSEQFALYFKVRINIWTFDVEDPMYPDHDYYFLTDDMQFLIEYDESFAYPHEIKMFLNLLYGDWGVEKTHEYLMQLTTESPTVAIEEKYQDKKERLAEYGFVDYFEALELQSGWSNLPQMHQYIKTKKKYFTAEIQLLGKAQCLHKNAVVAFQGKEVDFLTSELPKVQDEKRLDFLHFNFVRMINSSLALSRTWNSGSLSMTEEGRKVLLAMRLGMSYLLEIVPPAEEGIFAQFDFFDLFKVGKSLIEIELSTLKKSLKLYGLHDEQAGPFLGQVWNQFLEGSFHVPAQFFDLHSKKSSNIDHLSVYREWQNILQQLLQLLPFIQSFYLNFKKMVDTGLIRSDYYLNYDVESIDIESILLSAFINFCLGHYEDLGEGHRPKLGLSPQEFNSFMLQHFTEEGSPQLTQQIVDFAQRFGVGEVAHFTPYMQQLLKDHLSGYDVATLTLEELRHVGGPIILKVN